MDEKDFDNMRRAGTDAARQVGEAFSQLDLSGVSKSIEKWGASSAPSGETSARPTSSAIHKTLAARGGACGRALQSSSS